MVREWHRRQRSQAMNIAAPRVFINDDNVKSHQLAYEVNESKTTKSISDE